MARECSPSQKTKILVWGRAAGRWQYHGCAKRRDSDLITEDQTNIMLTWLMSSPLIRDESAENRCCRTISRMSQIP